MLMVVTVSSMRVAHHDGATPERLAPDVAKEIIHALHPASHQCAQQDRGVVVEGRAEHGRHRQDDVSIDHPLVKDLAHLADPGVDVDFGTTQAQRRFTAHRHAMCALSTLQTPVFDIPHLVRITTCEHLMHEGIIVTNGVSFLQTTQRA